MLPKGNNLLPVPSSSFTNIRKSDSQFDNIPSNIKREHDMRNNMIHTARQLRLDSQFNKKKH